MHRTAALIVGGGPAGSAVAITLARAGAMPVLVERCPAERDPVCGGFLGWDALAALKRLGLDPAALGARPIHRLRLVSGRTIVERALPFPAAGLSRRRLDASLLRMAEEAGAAVLRGRAARALDGLVVRLDDGEELETEALFLATGKHELRGAAREIGARKAAVGLRAALPAGQDQARALAGTIELHLYDGGYAGLLLQEDGMVNLCLSVSRARMAEASAPAALIGELAGEAPLLAERIGTPPDDWEAIAGVPYGWRARATGPDCYRVGDQAAVIASLAGDGIAIALASGIAAAHADLAGIDAADFQRGFATRSRRPIAIGEALRHMAEHRRERAVLMALARVKGAAALAARLTRIG
jgi:flavin-dependent dehydrogenase